ncbi:hypothetical protein ACFC0C_04125 [Streptomyces sp. NPDC056178]|uniref:hypothetical protein n=1 Tax=unclassified Streptomyces TaxID=2593676 RepID=UPI0035DEFA00
MVVVVVVVVVVVEVVVEVARVTNRVSARISVFDALVSAAWTLVRDVRWLRTGATA